MESVESSPAARPLPSSPAPAGRGEDGDGPAAPVADAAVERWFVRRGLPHFIAGYSAQRDVLTRALPLLAAVFVLEVLLALRLDWAVWANVAAFLAGAALLLGGYAAVNRLRGRPLLALPRDVGLVEVAVFVLLPPLLPAVIGGQWAEVAGSAAGNLVLLGVVYLTTSYGLVPMLRWAAVHTGRQLVDLLRLMIRTLPLLLLFGAFLFINAELWQVAADFTNVTFAATVGLLVLVGVGFFGVHLPRQLTGLAQFASWDEPCALLDGTPLAATRPAELPARPDAPPLGRAATVNAGLLLVVAQGVQILLVSVLIGAFFVAFGVIAIREATILAWTGAAAVEPLLTFTLWGEELIVTTELLRVAGFLAAFGGLHFTVSALTDEIYRREFAEEVVADLRQALAVRAVYLARTHQQED